MSWNTSKNCCLLLSVLIAFINVGCKQDQAIESQVLQVEVKSDSLQMSMVILPNGLGKFESKGKVIAVIPQKIGENEQEIDLYIIENSDIEIGLLDVDQIKKLSTPKKITSVDLLAQELNSFGLGGNITVERKVETTKKNGVLTVKDLDNKTTVTCTCPCTVTFGDGVNYSCD